MSRVLKVGDENEVIIHNHERNPVEFDHGQQRSYVGKPD